MARTKLSKCAFVDYGYGQVEPNLLSAQRTGQIYAQLPMAESVEVLENGQFAKYNYADGVVDFAGEGEWMLVFNAVKIYGDYDTEADFAMKAVKGATTGPVIGVTTDSVPRLFKTNVGDIFTTNTVKEAEVTEGAELYIGADGYLTTEENGDMKWQIVKVYTMPDGQKAVKIMRIA